VTCKCEKVTQAGCTTTPLFSRCSTYCFRRQHCASKLQLTVSWQTYMHDFQLLPQSRWEPRCSALLHVKYW